LEIHEANPGLFEEIALFDDVEGQDGRASRWSASDPAPNSLKGSAQGAPLFERILEQFQKLFPNQRFGTLQKLYDAI